MEFINSILLFIITGLIAAVGYGLRKYHYRNLNKIDIIGWKTDSIDHGVQVALPDEQAEKYKKKRNEKWDELIELNALKNKDR